MKIEHVAMYVNDIEEEKLFFEKYFGAKSNALYEHKEIGFKSYFLSFDGEARLEIMSRTDINESDKNIVGTGFIHVALSVGSIQKVDEITKMLKEDGYEVISGPRTTGDGYYESCVLDKEGNQIEITV